MTDNKNSTPPIWLLVLTVFTTGTCVLIIELVGTRLLSPFFGSGVYTWSSLIAITLGALALGYALAKFLGLSYENAAPTAMIGASNHFEVAIATSAMLYGLSSGAALATVVGVLIEVPLMLMLVRFCLRTQGWFAKNS